ncbi:MAG TPA: carboxypeptidase-like regulatory domain-containing protein [Pricia antarctica]|uniref:Carboxypeptidase-like regulatory domain-containing protein n=1 Tax=Pricia antarctica TaxID=641691 RepID=A0A831QPL3_9FLAO|nr:carboxypeptidase-like regulatory domain-containing protein [Pricia antarctica]
MKTVFLFVSLMLSMAAAAQSYGSVSGTIIDMEMNGEPLLFANIELKGAQKSAQTNLNGNFEIAEVDPGTYILAISFPGYETLEMPVKIEQNKRVSVQRELNAKSIDIGAALQAEGISKRQISGLVSSSSR